MARTVGFPGLRFHPTDVELIMFYLKKKVLGKRIRYQVIGEIDIYKFAPWDLPDKSCLRTKDLEWYFFCPRERRYTNGDRMKRGTEYGYWKTTGKDRSILYNERTVGMIKTLIFHTGKAPRGDRTDWVMHEYRMEDKDLAAAGVVQDSCVLCKIFQKSGPGPKNGAQYGAPFDEEEWSDDEEVSGVASFPLAGLLAPAPVLQNNQDRSAVTSMFVPGTICIGSSSESTLSKPVQFPDNMLRPVQDDDVSMLEISLPPKDDIISMLGCFSDDIILVPNESGKNENHDNVNRDGKDDNNIFNDLPELTEKELYFSNSSNTTLATKQMLACEDGSFLELNDLQSPLGGPSSTFGSDCTPIDTMLWDYNCYNRSEQPCNDFDAVQLASAISQPSVIPEGFYGFENLFDVFPEDNGQGYQEK